MKTAEEILKKHTGHAHGLMSASTIEAIKEYAKEVAREALKNANYRLTQYYFVLHDDKAISREEFKQVIEDESNIPKL